MDNNLLTYIEKADNLPSLPTVTFKVMKMAMDPETSIKQIADFMATDVALASKVLRVVNSSFYSPVNKIQNINQAAVILGAQVIRNIALQLSLSDAFPQKKQSNSYANLLEKSLCSGIAAEIIAKKISLSLSKDIFLSGLFSDIGMSIMMYFWPDDYLNVLNEAEEKGIEVNTVEEELLGTNHIQVGLKVAERWGLPQAIINSIKYHHDIQLAVQDKLPAQEIKALKCSYFGGIVTEIYYGWNKSRHIARFESEIETEFQINKETASEIISQTSEMMMDIGKSMEIDIDSETSYTQMLQNANSELGQINIKYDQMYRELQSVVNELKTKNDQLAKLTIELDEKNKLLSNLASKDGLTGLYNHRYFQTYLLKQFKLANRYARPLSLILLDIDHFKKINDTYGHQSGDIILKELAKILVSCVREVELAARYGGEEFVIVLPETILKHAVIVAERIRAKVEETSFKIVSGQEINITCSLGVSAFNSGISTTKELIETADKLLYAAKKGGRNKICVAA